MMGPIRLNCARQIANPERVLRVEIGFEKVDVVPALWFRSSRRYETCLVDGFGTVGLDEVVNGWGNSGSIQASHQEQM